VPRSDDNYDREYPFEVIQIHGRQHYPPPPFSVTEQFRSSLRRVLREKKTLSETATPYALRARELQNIYESLGRELELGDE